MSIGDFSMSYIFDWKQTIFDETRSHDTLSESLLWFGAQKLLLLTYLSDGS